MLIVLHPLSMFSPKLFRHQVSRIASTKPRNGYSERRFNQRHGDLCPSLYWTVIPVLSAVWCAWFLLHDAAPAQLHKPLSCMCCQTCTHLELSWPSSTRYINTGAGSKAEGLVHDGVGCQCTKSRNRGFWVGRRKPPAGRDVEDAGCA